MVRCLALQVLVSDFRAISCRDAFQAEMGSSLTTTATACDAWFPVAVGPPCRAVRCAAVATDRTAIPS
jgi:hypothetical protein